MRRTYRFWKGWYFPLLLVCSFPSTAEPLWSRALSGSVLAGPVASDNRVYTVGTDNSISCLSAKGDFLWNRLLPGKAAPSLTVSSLGTVYALTESGVVSAFNGDGSPLWQLRGSLPPLFPVREGRDGRFFLVYRSTLRCVSASGALKWTVVLDNQPLMPLSETGDGDLLLVCEGSLLLRISPFGEILERSTPGGQITSLAPLPGGYAAGFATGQVQVFDVRDGRGGNRNATELLWQFRGSSPCGGLSYGAGTLLSAHSDGTLYGLNGTDGSLLWTVSAGVRESGSFIAVYDDGQFNIVSSTLALGLDPAGRSLWRCPIPSGQFSPVISGQGLVFAADRNWVLYAYRGETRINPEKKAQNRLNYGILNGVSAEYELLFTPDGPDVYSFFERVNQDITQGRVGPSEVEYARRLTEIMRNDSGNLYIPLNFTAQERGRAASLLGQLGSLEYRSVLIEQAHAPFDSSFALGVLFGLAAIGYDPDGQSLNAIAHIVREAGSAHDAVLFAACDTLYAIIRYSGGEKAIEGTRMLCGFLSDPYGTRVADYARQKLESILN